MLGVKIVVVVSVAAGAVFSPVDGRATSGLDAAGGRAAAREMPSLMAECSFECAADNCPAYSHEVNIGGSKDASGPEHGCGATGFTCSSAHGCGVSAVPQTADWG